MFTKIKGYYQQERIFMEEDAPVDSKTGVIVTFHTEDVKNSGNKKRMPGGLKGKVAIPDDFNEPVDGLKNSM